MRYWTKHLKQLGCILLFLTAFFAGNAPLLGQNKKELEEKRQKILRDIETTNRMLKTTTENKETVFDQFVTLQNQIKSRETLITTLNEQVISADSEIEQNKSVIATLQSDVSRLREDYGRMLRSAYRRRKVSHPLLFIFSAQSLNQIVARWIFLRNFDRFRRQQGVLLASTQESLTQKISEIRLIRDDKAMLLASMKGQKDTLGAELSDQNLMLRTLSKDETRLKNDLIKKQATYEVLNRGIEKIIQEEVQKRAETTKKTTIIKKTTPAPTEKPADPNNSAISKTSKTEVIKKVEPEQPVVKTDNKPKPTPSEKRREPETENAEDPESETASEDAQSTDFRRQRGRLPWPVQSGFVSRGFGRQRHPTLKNIEITNNGIDIRTDENAAVAAVEAGRVAGVQFIPGHNYTVVIQHGDYYTVYSNLTESNVQKGDNIRARQVLGRVSANNITGTTELHFEVWREKERLNPAAWIKK